MIFKRMVKSCCSLALLQEIPVFFQLHFFFPGGVMQFGHKADNNVRLLN